MEKVSPYRKARSRCGNKSENIKGDEKIILLHSRVQEMFSIHLATVLNDSSGIFLNRLLFFYFVKNLLLFCFDNLKPFFNDNLVLVVKLFRSSIVLQVDTIHADSMFLFQYLFAFEPGYSLIVKVI